MDPKVLEARQAYDKAVEREQEAVKHLSDLCRERDEAYAHLFALAHCKLCLDTGERDHIFDPTRKEACPRCHPDKCYHGTYMMEKPRGSSSYKWQCTKCLQLFDQDEMND